MTRPEIGMPFCIGETEWRVAAIWEHGIVAKLSHLQREAENHLEVIQISMTEFTRVVS